MNIRERYDEIFNESAMHTIAMDEKTRRWIFTIGFQEGMREAARVLEREWFKTQEDCGKAIRSAAGKL